MANTTLTADIVAKEALAVLDNELSWISKIHRAHEEEFDKSVNGYKVGETISIRRPADLTVRTGPVMASQDVIEGKVPLTVDQQIGVDFAFSSTDLTLKISDLSERVIRPAIVNIANFMANDVATEMYRGAYNWAGTAGQRVNSFSDFYAGAQRLNEMSVPMGERTSLLSPADYGALLGSQTALSNTGTEGSAYRRGEIGTIGGIETYMSQLTPVHLTGSRTNSTPLTDGDAQNVAYDAAKNTWTQTIVTDGWTASVTLTAGDVFTIDNVFMVNKKTRVSTGILQQFVVMANTTANASAANDTVLTISPPIITSGPHQTVTYTGSFDNRAIVNVGAASTRYDQNLMFHKNAMALAIVPMEHPQGAVNCSRKTADGISVRVIPVYDGTNDVSKWRLDLLYGRKLIDPRLITRLSGTA